MATNVFVDELMEYGGSKTFKWKVSCHMFCAPGCIDELHEAARAIGLKRSWFQGEGVLPHYDLTANKRKQAVSGGHALEVDNRKMLEYRKRWLEIKLRHRVTTLSDEGLTREADEVRGILSRGKTPMAELRLELVLDEQKKRGLL